MAIPEICCFLVYALWAGKSQAAFHKPEVSVDPFYSESNMAAIDEAAKQIERGQVIVKTIEELAANVKDITKPE